MQQLATLATNVSNNVSHSHVCDRIISLNTSIASSQLHLTLDGLSLDRVLQHTQRRRIPPHVPNKDDHPILDPSSFNSIRLGFSLSHRLFEKDVFARIGTYYSIPSVELVFVEDVDYVNGHV